jgi:hypothetical protein
MLIVVETHFLDESTHTGIDRRNVTPHLCIISIFYVAPMHKSAANESDKHYEG